MTPAIQNQESTDMTFESHPYWGNANASKISGNLTQIFKNMTPFPQDLPSPKGFCGLDLGEHTWVAAYLGASGKVGFRNFTGDGKRFAFVEWLKEKSGKEGISDLRDVVVCFEIGRCGVWPMRYMNNAGIPCVIMSPDVISENRRKAKNDRLDAQRLAERLRRFFHRELECSHVYVPVPDEIIEARSSERLREVIVKQKTRAAASFKSLLATYTEVPSGLDLTRVVVSRLSDCLGNPLPPNAVRTLEYHLECHRECCEKIKALDKEARLELNAARRQMASGLPLRENDRIMAKLNSLLCIGLQTSRCLARELFWKTFRNVRQVGSAVGLVDVPDSSGTVSRSGGISRCANGRLRKIAIELAWQWVRRQPGSELSRWFSRRAQMSKAMKKKSIVAVARKLVVALWKYIQFDIVPGGARLRTA